MVVSYQLKVPGLIKVVYIRNRFLSVTAASEIGLLAPYRGDVVLKYAKPSRRNLDDWTEGAYGCLESRRPIYQINAVSSPHLYCFHAGWGTFRKSAEVGHVAFQHEYGFSNSMELDDC